MSVSRMNRLMLGIGALSFVLAAATVGLCAAPLTFEKVIEYLDLEVKEERILKQVEESTTVFTLGTQQIELLKSKGASDALVEALRKKGGDVTSKDAVSASDISDFVLILDASGSMKDMTPEGKSKWEVATQAALDIIAAVPESRNLAFIVYGHDARLECNAVEVIRPLSPITEKSRSALATRIGQLKPIGHTPIAKALALANEELQSSAGLSKVVLITDGMETCHGDPVRTAADLARNERLKGGVNVIGLGLNDKESAAVSQIAKAGRGNFHDARNATELVKTVKAVNGAIASTAAPKMSSAVKSNVKPSKDASNPAPLELGKYASARLGEGKAHYFSMDLPAGEYVAVADFKRSDKLDSNLIFNGYVDGDRIIAINDIDLMTRGANKFRVKGGMHTFTVENRNSGPADEYYFAVYRATDTIPGPYIEHSEHSFTTFSVGTSVSVRLNPESIDSRYAFYRVKLDEGDYSFSFALQSAKATGNFGAVIDEVNPYGMILHRIDSSYDSSKHQVIKQKLILADETELLLRIKVMAHDPIDGVLTITKLGTDDAKD